MRRFSIVLALAFVLAMGGMVFAQSIGERLPMNATPTTTWELSGDEWVVTSNAQSFNSMGTSGHCNRACWDVTLQNHVSVAEWIDWEINGTRKDWRVLKPGTYASDPLRPALRATTTCGLRSGRKTRPTKLRSRLPADLDVVRLQHRRRQRRQRVQRRRVGGGIFDER